MIPITRPFFDEEEAKAIQEPLATGWVLQGPQVARFEERLAAYVGARFGVATSSGTAALHLALLALGIGPGDEVIVPAFTFVATANAVEHAGATAVFCDISLATYNLDPARLPALITRRTRAILPVHNFGLSADVGAIAEVAARHGLAIVEDAACGLGAAYRGEHVGTFGAAGCFSFHPRKTITTGEGGMIVTGDPDLAARCRSLRNHGATRSALDRHRGRGALLAAYPDLGYNFRMTDLQGAVGNAQMGKLPTILDRLRERAARYDAALAGQGWLLPPTAPEGYGHAYQSYVCLLRKERWAGGDVERAAAMRARLMEALEARGIATRQANHAVPLLGYYQRKYGLPATGFPNAVEADRLSLALPLFAGMTDEEQDRVVAALAEAVPAVTGGERWS